MARMSVDGRSMDIDVVVFDKDGLLFDSRHFWKCLAEARIRQLSFMVDSQTVAKWCRAFGVSERDGRVTGVDPNGILALASVQDEIVATATVIKSCAAWDWEECRSKAKYIFTESDREFDLPAALQPKQGFPDIFIRLRETNILYGIATSDDKERAVESVNRFDSVDKLAFLLTPADVSRGKPYPDMLIKAAQLTGAPMERIAMVGDSFVDMQMAKEAGCIGIGIPDNPRMREKMKPYADIIIDSLDRMLFENAPF